MLSKTALYCTINRPAAQNPNGDSTIPKYEKLISCHIASLVAGTGLFAASAALVAVNGLDDNSISSNITVFVLTLLGVFVEVSLHFVADKLSDMDDFSTSKEPAASNTEMTIRLSRRQLAALKRVDTLFLILMGAGS